MFRALIVGESKACQVVAKAISLIDGQSSFASDLPAARESMAASMPDLVAVDLALRPPGDADMEALCAACKKASRPAALFGLVPSAELSARPLPADLDDFASCPCTVQELSVRLGRLMRRHQPADGPSLLRIHNLVIDLARYEVTQDGQRMDLTFKEYELLKFLATNPGKVFTREALLNKVWGYDYFGGTRTVDVHIRRLRSKIETGPFAFIDTVRNVGYRLRDSR